MNAAPLQAKNSDEVLVRQVLEGWKIGLALEFHPAVVESPVAVSHGSECGLRPFLFTDDMLQVLHILRC